MPKTLLDTDILSALLRQQAAVVNRATQYLSLYPQYTFSLITRYEILRGLKAKNAERQWVAFDVFCQSLREQALSYARADDWSRLLESMRTTSASKSPPPK